MFPWVQQNQKSLSLKTNLIENDQIHCLYVRKHEMCFWPNLRTKWKNNLALISMSILFFCFCKHFKKKKRNMSYLPFCNKKISSIFCRIIFSPPYTNYPQYTTYGWIRNEKTTKITTSCSVHRVNKCVCKIQFRTWFLFVLDSYSKRMSKKCYQFFINENLKKWIYFSPAFYHFMWLMKSPIFFF